jgi:hypothetical protein
VYCAFFAACSPPCPSNSPCTCTLNRHGGIASFRLWKSPVSNFDSTIWRLACVPSVHGTPADDGVGPELQPYEGQGNKPLGGGADAGAVAGRAEGGTGTWTPACTPLRRPRSTRGRSTQVRGSCRYHCCAGSLLARGG